MVEIKDYQLGGILAVVMVIVGFLLFSSKSILESLFLVFSYETTLTHLLLWIIPGLVIGAASRSMGKGASTVFWSSFYMFIFLYGYALFIGRVKLPHTVIGEFDLIQSYLYPLVANFILGGIGGIAGTGVGGLVSKIFEEEKSYKLPGKDSKLPTTCSNCGNDIYSNSAYCSECGEKIS